jgi:hypothetical protein
VPPFLFPAMSSILLLNIDSLSWVSVSPLVTPMMSPVMYPVPSPVMSPSMFSDVSRVVCRSMSRNASHNVFCYVYHTASRSSQRIQWGLMGWLPSCPSLPLCLPSSLPYICRYGSRSVSRYVSWFCLQCLSFWLPLCLPCLDLHHSSVFVLLLASS